MLDYTGLDFLHNLVVILFFFIAYKAQSQLDNLIVPSNTTDIQ
jgi:hypothetical protein